MMMMRDADNDYDSGNDYDCRDEMTWNLQAANDGSINQKKIKI